MATRRKVVSVDIPIASSIETKKGEELLENSSTMEQLDSAPPYDSPFLPTLIEALLLSVYPATLIVGSLFSTITIDHERTPYIPSKQSYDPANAPSYFAKKSNIFNVYFVKAGWGWITLAFVVFVFGSRTYGPNSWLSAPQKGITKQRLQAVVRYAFLTATWFSFTQAFFGAPLIDRGFKWTGGTCEIMLSDDPISQAKKSQMSKAAEAATHAACRLIGGEWKGGHDISGHVFLLVMGSAMLWFEVLPSILGWAGFTKSRRIVRRDGHVGGPRSSEFSRDMGEHAGLISIVPLVVGGISWWMLLMTAAYFHTWFEKLTGLIVALSFVYLTYFLPRVIPGLRGVFGMPGV